MDRDSVAAEILARALSEPPALDTAKAAAAGAGPWAAWTFDRQCWFLRRRAGISQIELARRSGVTQARISRIEAGGDAKWSTLRKLWTALGYEPLVLPGLLGRKLEGRKSRKVWSKRSAAISPMR